MVTSRGESGNDPQRAAAVRNAAMHLDTGGGPGLDAILQKAGQCQVVLIGESSHGTSDFYRLRQLITQRLIDEHGFNIIAVEADWPDAGRVDDYVRGRSPRDLPTAGVFKRFPRWMWRNAEFEDFTNWLRARNAAVPDAEQCSFHGLDLYSLNSSIHEVIRFLDQRDHALGQVARERYSCILPFADEPQDYGHAVLLRQHRDCEGEVAAMLADLLRREIGTAIQEKRDTFDAQQNARIIRNAERYYRAVYRGSIESWNVRDRHMFETLLELMAARGSGARVVVWAHNTHVGDASATQMGIAGEVNIGQLVQEHFVNRACSIGFGTHTGTVAAASNWDEPVEIKTVRPSIEGSIERLMHDTGLPMFALNLADAGPQLREALAGKRLQRAIGVIYRPDNERVSHYFLASLMRQFDAYIWVDESSAVQPLDGEGPLLRHPAIAGHPFAHEDR